MAKRDTYSNTTDVGVLRGVELPRDAAARLQVWVGGEQQRFVKRATEEREVVLSCWIVTDSDAERLNVRLGKPL